MIINNIASLFSTHPPGGDIKAFLLQSLGEDSPEGFLSHLSQQLEENADDEFLQSLISILNGDFPNERMPDGQLLPPPAISDPVTMYGGPGAVVSEVLPDIDDGGATRPLLTKVDTMPVDPFLPPRPTNSVLSNSTINPGLNGAEAVDITDESLASGPLRSETGIQLSTQSEPRQPVQPVLNLQRNFGQPQWQQEFSERIMWMTNKSVDSAQVRLNPPQLGPVEVRISLNQEQANVAFSAHNPAVREAIEAAIPRLREMMGSQQLNLVDVDVSQHSFAQQQNMKDHPSQRENMADSGSESGGDPVFQENTSISEAVGSDGLLSYYV